MRRQARGPVPSLGGLMGRLGQGGRGSDSEGRTRGLCESQQGGPGPGWWSSFTALQPAARS